MRRAINALLLVGLAILPGCARFLPMPPAPTAASVELASVPFVPQSRYQCGPAALATVLQHSGIAVSAVDLVGEVYLPAKRGSLQAEISAAARRHGRVPFRIGPSEQALLEELRAGNPVLILQNLAIEQWPRWHYAVVVGYLPDGNRWVLRSGRERRHLDHRRRFSHSWEGADRWGIVLLPPGRLPASGDAAGVARALAAAESTLGGAALLPSWEMATERWPAEADLAFAAANAARAAGDNELALDYYRRALDLNTTHLATRNNLADLLLELGCSDRARATLEPALQAIGPAHPLSSLLHDTAEATRNAIGHPPEAQAACPRLPEP